MDCRPSSGQSFPGLQPSPSEPLANGNNPIENPDDSNLLYQETVIDIPAPPPYCEYAFNEQKIHCDDGLPLKGGFTASSFIKRKLGADAINGHKLSLLIFLNIIVIIIVLYLAFMTHFA